VLFDSVESVQLKVSRKITTKNIQVTRAMLKYLTCDRVYVAFRAGPELVGAPGRVIIWLNFKPKF
jgi:hypothetical protein